VTLLIGSEKVTEVQCAKCHGPHLGEWWGSDWARGEKVRCDKLDLMTFAALQVCTLLAVIKQQKLEMWATLPNIGGALCSTPQSMADAHY